MNETNNSVFKITVSILMLIMGIRFIVAFESVGMFPPTFTELSTLGQLSDFETREELLVFLMNDTTDEIPFDNISFVCLDYVTTLKSNAVRSGYRIRSSAILTMSAKERYCEMLLVVGYNTTMSSDGGHAVCRAYIVDESQWVTIEPQLDLVMNGTVGLP